MKAKQKRIRVFDIVVENEDKFFEFMDKNLILVKDYLLLISGNITQSVIDYLNNNSLCFVSMDDCHIKRVEGSSSEPIPVVQEQTKTSQPEVIIKEQIIHEKSENKTIVLNKPIRSGEVVESDGDIVVFSRVNSGAKVICEGNVSIYDVIDGIVESYGDFMIVSKLGKGHIIFNGDILDKELFEGGTKKVIKTKDSFKIEDL